MKIQCQIGEWSIFVGKCDDNSTIYNDLNVKNVHIISQNNRFQWERGNGDDNDESSCSGGILSAIFGGNCDEDDDDTTTIMLNADIALVRTFGDNLSEDGDVSCDFRGRDACPAADTLEQMAAYRMDNDLWLNDFKAAWEKMLIHNCTACTEV